MSMPRSIATTTLSGELSEKINAAADAGFNGIEIFANDILYSKYSASDICKQAEDAGIEIVALQPFRDFEALPTTQRQKAFDLGMRKMDLAEQLGTSRLLICSSVSPYAIDDPARAADDLAELAELAAKRGLEIGYEALAWGRHVRDVSQSWDIVKRADHPALGIVLDSFHLFARGNPLQCLDDIPADKITLVQIADAPDIHMDVLQLSRHFRCFPGQGDYPVTDFVRCIKNKGYKGYISHEIFSDELKASSPGVVARDAYRSLRWLEADVENESPSEEIIANGVEFIEFATDDAHRPFLVTLLEKLKFVRTHQHKSKAVWLYQQGEINIVVNCEPDSFSSQYFQLHGASVCAIGLGVGSPKVAIKRLEERRYQVVDTIRAADEMDLPAIQGVGDGLIYLCPTEEHSLSFIDADFERLDDYVEAKEVKKTGLTCIDHIGQSVDHTEFLSALLFYRDALSMDPEPSHDVVDPRGMMFSRSLSSKNKKVRFPISTSNSSHSSSARFRERYHGSGTQQLAFATDDIFAFAEGLDADRVLPIPMNYYDDLEATYSLDDQKIQAMRQYNILYDKSDTGDFFHLYLREFNGLFIEIVQRNGYTNFGEVNATIRLASQAREDVRIKYPDTIISHPKNNFNVPVNDITKGTYATLCALNEQVKLPRMMNDLFNNLDIDAAWIPIQLPVEGLTSAFELFRHSENLKGFNISRVYQKEVLDLVDSVSDAASEAGRINLVKQGTDGHLFGDWVNDDSLVEIGHTYLRDFFDLY